MNELLTAWRWTARTANVANLRVTDSLNWRNFALGGISATLGAIVGLGIFATLQEGTAHLWVRIVAGGVAFLAAGLAALWKNLEYATRAKDHEKASRAYGNIVRRIDLELESVNPITDAVAKEVREALDKVDSESPNVPPLVWAWASEGVAQERKAKEHHKPPLDASTINRGALSRLRRVGTRIFK